MRFSRLTNIASVEQKPVMRLRNKFRRDIFDQGFFGLEGVLTVRCQTESLTYPEDMRVDGHRRLVPYHGTHHVRGLSAYALQGLQLLYRVRHLSVVDLHKPLRHFHQVLDLRYSNTSSLVAFAIASGVG